MYFTKRFHIWPHFVSSVRYRVTSDGCLIFHGVWGGGERSLCLDLKNLPGEFHCPFIWIAHSVLYTLIHESSPKVLCVGSGKYFFAVAVFTHGETQSWGRGGRGLGQQPGQTRAALFLVWSSSLTVRKPKLLFLWKINISKVNSFANQILPGEQNCKREALEAVCCCPARSLILVGPQDGMALQLKPFFGCTHLPSVEVGWPLPFQLQPCPRLRNSCRVSFSGARMGHGLCS